MSLVVVSRPFVPSGTAPPCYPWDQCSLSGNDAAQVYKNVLEPWISEKITTDTSINYMEKANSPWLPGINLYGVSPTEFETLHVNREERTKTKGTFKEFEEAKASGKIVLKPMRALKLDAHALPNILPTTPPLKARQFIGYQHYFGGGKPVKPGQCRSNFYQVPPLSLDCQSQGEMVNYESYTNPTMIPVSKTDLESILSDVSMFLDRSEPNGTLITKVVSEANSATFDVATEIGELPETIKMIVNGVKQGILLVLRAKKEIKQQLSSGSVVKDAASLWMAYRYGLMPIVYSINDGLDLLEMEVKKFQTFRGRFDEPVLDFSARGYSCISRPDVEHRCFLKYGYDIEALVHQGLKLNLASTAWELIPLSFVFDWFFQVGDFLTAKFTPGAVDQIGCMYSYRVKGAYVFENETKSRITIYADYYRSEIIDPDSFIGINSEVFVSFKRVMDAISLSWLLFKKDKSRG